jgi:protein-disulfide isomerase
MTKARDLANASTALSAVSATELGYLDGVTSAVQTQINAKQAVVSGVSDAEIGYLDGVTSAVQTQINAKQKAITVSTSDPSGGSDGDIWIKYTP